MAGEEASADGGAPALIETVAPAVEAPVAAPAESAIETAADPVVEAPVEEAPAAELETEVDPTPEPAAEPVAELVAEAAPAVEAPAGELASAEVAAPLYDAFTLPEGFTAPTEQIEAFTGVLGKYGLTQEAGQELMDLHAGSLQQMADHMAQQQQDVFAETRRGWVQDFDKSAGNRRDTVLNDAKFAITELVPDEKARTELWNVLALTGAGDHKAVIQAFASAAPRLRERAAPPAGLPATGAKTNPAERRYGAKS